MKNPFLAFVFILGIFFSACEEMTDVSLPEEETLLVVNSFFNPDSEWAAHVTLSQDRLNNEDFRFVENATVEVWQGNSKVADLDYAADGFYRAANVRPRSGLTYELRVSAPDFPMVTASDAIPPRISIASVELDTLQGSSELGETKLNFQVTVRDPGNARNYYLIQVYEQQEWGSFSQIFSSTDQAILESSANDDLETGEHYFEAAIFDDELFNGTDYPLDISLSLFQHNPESDGVYIVLRSISEAYYRYWRTADLQSYFGENPFVEPILIYNNIENGIGIFAGFDSDTVRVEL